jgi:hypothetical protein
MRNERNNKMYHNIASLYGQVLGKPVINRTPEKTDVDARFSVKILRRPYLNKDGVLKGNLHSSSPLIAVRDKGLIQKVARIKKGDMVSIRGVLSSADIKKSSTCVCGNVKAVSGTLVYVNALNIRRCVKGVDQNRGFELLKENVIESNNVVMFGSLCRAPEIYEPVNGKATRAQYQIAVNRIARNIDNIEVDSKHKDYIWVKNFGEQAAETMKYENGDRVFIEGSIDTRTITRTTQCDKCGIEYEWDETVTDVIPYITEHFRKYC